MPYTITTASPTETRPRMGAMHRIMLALNGVLIWTFILALPLPGIFTVPADRTLYFKLPIEGVRFHWEFQDAAAFLAGELTLRIINDTRDQTLVIFRDGQIQPGWEMIGDPSPDSSFYFGFSTDERFRTAKDDSLIITLKVVKDLLGRGPHSEGVLAAGTWQATGTYSSLYGRRWNPLDFVVLTGDAPVAFMECWANTWPVTITKNEGWKGAKPEGEDDLGFVRKLMQKRGVNGRLCGSHQ